MAWRSGVRPRRWSVQELQLGNASPERDDWCQPGNTAFIRILAVPHSFAMERISPRAPALLAAYAACPVDPCVLAKELTIKTDPFC